METGRLRLETLLRRYGQTVVLRRGGEETETRAFMQPILDERRRLEQQRPTPLGPVREDRFLYLGRADLPLTGGEDRVAWQGECFLVQTAHPVYLGQTLSHWWAVLVPRGEESP